ncbi:type III-D CRISPR-associated protein Csx19 [Shouchella lehensis]|uniref:Uncharacterized protein n=1 Tax=Shouchella lehensis TaxID=300825 RepID=A0A4Y7WMN0_9BACI|nr:CRISPR-associated protein Csx19 [Shouchella lehensis]MBG9782991.1 hypothetical protein [Shouchella lehensis]TES49651.1 hypothetical protein E2L03_09330 [Shouchella lehensis]
MQIKVQTGKSSFEKYDLLSEGDLLQSIPNFGSDTFVYAVFDDQICFGTYKDETINLFDRGIEETREHLLELRIFSKEKEYRAIRAGQHFRARIIEEHGHGNDSHYIEETHKVWGKVSSVKEDWIHLKETRGAQLHVPYWLKKGEQLGLRVRQYIEFSDENYAFVDERFVGFVRWEDD